MCGKINFKRIHQSHILIVHQNTIQSLENFQIEGGNENENRNEKKNIGLFLNIYIFKEGKLLKNRILKFECV